MHIQKSTQKRIIDLNLKPKNIQLLIENIGENPCDLWLGKDFLDIIPSIIPKRTNWSIGLKFKNISSLEQTYGHQGGKTAVRWGWWCAELGDWDWQVYTDVYKTDA